MLLQADPPQAFFLWAIECFDQVILSLLIYQCHQALANIVLGKKVISDQYFGIHQSGTDAKNIVLLFNAHNSHNILLDAYLGYFRTSNRSRLIPTLMIDHGYFIEG